MDRPGFQWKVTLGTCRRCSGPELVLKYPGTTYENCLGCDTSVENGRPSYGEDSYPCEGYNAMTWGDLLSLVKEDTE